MNTMDYEPEPQSDADLSVDSFKIDYLRRFIDKCKEKNLRLIFAVSLTDKAVSIDFQSSTFNATNNRQLKTLNNYSDTTFTAHKVLFSDVTHINQIGANEYSKAISKEIQQMKCDK